MKIDFTVITKITVDAPDDIDVNEVIQEVTADMDYSFQYDENGIKIINTEIVDLNVDC